MRNKINFILYAVLTLFFILCTFPAIAANPPAPALPIGASYNTGSNAWPNPRFVDNGDQTITDKLTGLIWPKNANIMSTRDRSFDTDYFDVRLVIDGAVTWQHALDYIHKLNDENYLGFNDWRLPNRNELKSLYNAEQSSPDNWLMSVGFTNAPSIGSSYWSSSGGTVAFAIPSSSGWNYGHYVWPVRSVTNGLINLPRTGMVNCFDSDRHLIPCVGNGQDGDLQKGVAWPNPRFVDNGDQTMTDRLTALIWSKDTSMPGPSACDPGVKKTWQGAFDYIKCLNDNDFLGYRDWRLPNRNELSSLDNISQSASDWLSSVGFVNLPQEGGYWSSTLYVPYSGVGPSAWHMYINTSGSAYNKNQLENVWPVRDVTLTSITPQFGNFGSVPNGNISEAKTFTISNVSAIPLTIGNLAAVGQDADLIVLMSDNCSSQVLDIGSSCTFQVAMASNSNDLISATIYEKNTVRPISIILTGNDSVSPTGWIKINNGAIFTTNTAVDLFMSAIDNSGYVADMRFSRDGLSWNSWKSYNSTKKWNLASGDGLQEVYVQFKDAAGNISSTYSSGIFLDTTSPHASFVSVPPNPSFANGSFTFSSSESGSTFECSMDSGSYSTCVSPFAFSAFSAGEHVFSVRAKDAAGNIDSNPANYSWTVIPPEPPETSITQTPKNPSLAAVTFNFSSLSGASFECRIGSGVFSACTSPKSYTNLASGDHTFEVRSKDSAGNIDQTPASFTWTVDTIKPIVISTVPSNNTLDVSLNNNITVTFSEDIDPGTLTPSSFLVSNGVVGTISYESLSRTATFTPSAPLLPNTKYTVIIMSSVKDIAGNTIASNYGWSFTTAVTLTVGKTGAGTGNIVSNPAGIDCGSNCAGTYNIGTLITLTAVPGDGSIFIGWSHDCLGTDAVCPVTMDAVKTVTAMFAPSTFVIATTAGNGGIISPVSPSANYGASQTFTIVPGDHFHIVDVQVDGSSVGAVTTYSFNDIIDVHTISATFAIDTHDLTVTKHGDGSGDVAVSAGNLVWNGSTGSTTYNFGMLVTLTATPNNNSDFTGWSGVCTGTGSCTLTIDSAKTVTATFSLKTFVITTVAGSGGMIMPSSQSISYGSSQTFTIIPEAHYHILDVKVDGASVGGVMTYEFGHVTAAHEISATFAMDTHILTVTKSGTGSGDVSVSPGSLEWNGSTGNATYAYETLVTTTATPQNNSNFTGWLNVCTGTGSCAVTIDSNKTIVASFTLKGDPDSDGAVTLADAIMVLKAISGIPSIIVNKGADVNGDNRLGLEDVIYIMQKVTLIR